MNHTPAPWSADAAGLITAGPNRLHIAQTVTTGMGHAADANARLLAAAPELYTALRGMLQLFADTQEMEDYETVQAARAAIANATN